MFSAPYFEIIQRNKRIKATTLKQDVVVPMGNTLYLACPARGNPRPEVDWLKDGNPIADFNRKTVRPESVFWHAFISD